MKSVRANIELNQHVLSYLKAGSGPEILLAFHGFGQSAEEFISFLEPLESKYTIYAFDHFFHGKSIWNSDKPIDLKIFVRFFDLFLDQEKVDKFQVLAYSLGGKWAYEMVNNYPDRISRLNLCAPDGAKTTFYYDFSTKNPLGRFLFKRSVAHPGMYFGLLRTLLKTGLLPKKLYRFAYFHMNDASKRNQVANTWIKYRNFKGLTKRNKKLINDYEIPLHLILGKYDSVIRPAWFIHFKTKFPHMKMTIVKKGHSTILKEVADVMSNQKLRS